MNVVTTLFEPRWKLALYLVVLLAIGFAAYQLTTTRSELAEDPGPVEGPVSGLAAEKPGETPGPGAESARLAEGSDKSDSEPAAKTGDDVSSEGPTAGNEAPMPAGSEAGQAAGARQASWLVADELLTTLSDLTLSEELLTAEQVRELTRALAGLAAQGEAAIPAIRDFLREGMDLSMAEMVDADTQREAGLVEFASLRLGLFDVLRQIGGRQAEGVMYEELKNTRLPQEVGALADYLEEQSPGSYGPEAAEIARETLVMAAEGQLEAQDVGPLFHVLESYGDAEVVAELEKNVDKRWGQYAVIALGGVAEGEGVPVLMDMVEGYKPSDKKTNVYSDKGLLALQTLTQVAENDFAASKMLIDKARADQIPAHMWPKIASVLAGDDQLQINKPDIDLRTVAPYSTSKVKKYPYNTHRIGQNVVYSVHDSAQLPEEEVMARLNLIGRLLEATDDPEAKKALRESTRLLTESSR